MTKSKSEDVSTPDASALSAAQVPPNPARSTAAQALFDRVYGELHRLAEHYMRGERSNHTLQPTALVHEAYVKLADRAQTEQGEVRWESREQFLGTAAQAMRFVLVDHARARSTQKRASDGERVLLQDALEIYEERAIDLLALNSALEALAKVDEQLARIVELRFFAGLNCSETAAALNVSTRTVERGWWTARAWLRHAMQEDEADGQGRL